MVGQLVGVARPIGGHRFHPSRPNTRERNAPLYWAKRSSFPARVDT